jgi:hypothetical protein
MPNKAPKQKAKREPRSVLGTLPSSRPQRLGSPRTTARATTTGTRGATAKASAKTVKRVKPAAVRAASPPLQTHRPKATPPPRPIGAPRGRELVTTTIRAAGELTQVGLTVGGLMIKRAVDRIPRP